MPKATGLISSLFSNASSAFLPTVTPTVLPSWFYLSLTLLSSAFHSFLHYYIEEDLIILVMIGNKQIQGKCNFTVNRDEMKPHRQLS